MKTKKSNNKTSKSKWWWLFFILTFSFQPLTAQLVNIEKFRKELKPGWQGKLDFAFNLNQNTKKILQFSNTINTQYTYKRHTLLLLNDITILQVREADKDNYNLINRNFQHIRYNFSLDSNYNTVYELFTQRQENKIKYIKLRFLLGTGFRFALVNRENFSIYLAPLIMYEFEQLTDSAGTITRMIKGDFYISMNAKLTDNLSFSHVTYYQPALIDLGSNIPFERFSDFRVSSESELTIEIIENFLEFSINLDLSYDSRPPAELLNYPLFYTLKNKLTFKI